MIAVYGIFFAEVAAYRLGTKRLERLGVAYSEPYSSSYHHPAVLSVPTSQLTFRRLAQ
jgi:hypothetical protein